MACECISKINGEIGPSRNAVLVTTLFGEQKAVIGTVKLDSTKRGKPPVMLATFCPFCGGAYGATALAEPS